VRVEAVVPANMEPGVSVPVTLSVVPADNQAPSVREALEEYGVTALSASLGGPEFNATPTEPQDSPWVNEQQLQWTWVVSPRTAGAQTLRIGLRVKGKPDWSEEPIEGEIWSGLVVVQVGSGGFDLGNMDLFGPLNALAGLGLTIPWIYEQAKTRLRRRSTLQTVTAGTPPEVAEPTAPDTGE